MAQDVLDLSGLQTEAINERTNSIDRVSTLQMCTMINGEDKTVADSVTACVEDIARAIDLLVPRVRAGGRVIYVGAGTSGRLVSPMRMLELSLESDRNIISIG